MTIKIQWARYGVPDHYADVTVLIQLMVMDSNRAIAINNESMGGDPAVGHGKKLTVAYFRNNGLTHTIEGPEGSTISLVDEPHGLPASPQWLIG